MKYILKFFRKIRKILHVVYFIEAFKIIGKSRDDYYSAIASWIAMYEDISSFNPDTGLISWH